METSTNAAKTSVQDTADSMEKKLSSVRASVKKNLLDTQDAIKQTTTGAKDSANQMKDAVESGLSSASTQAIAAATQVSVNLDAISIVPFIWVFFMIVAASVGIVLMRLCRSTKDVYEGAIRTNPNMFGKVYALNHIGSMGARLIAASWFLAFIFSGVTGLFSAVAIPGTQVYTDASIRM